MSLFRNKRYKRIHYGKNAGNRVIIHMENGKIKNNPRSIKGVKVRFRGKNSTLELYEPCLLDGAEFYLYNGDNIIIKKSQGRIYVVGGDRASLFIDEGCTLQNTHFFLNDWHNVSVVLGKDCMFSIDVSILASDTHKIIDKTSGKIVNQITKDGVVIGDHVWCGNRVLILKNSKIRNNCVVGAGSIVSGDFPEPNCVICGVPAKKVKNNIDWDREGFFIKE